MKLVIDANIVFSALIAGSLTDVILSPELELIAPDLMFTEIRCNKSEVKKKSRLSDREFEFFLAILERKIKLIPFTEFFDKFEEAEKMFPNHKKDVPYVALALKTECAFWTYEKRFESKINVMTTAELRSLLNV